MAKVPKTPASKSQKGETTCDEEDVPPDGGWGWMVVTGYIFAGATFIPIIQNFGLVYKQRFESLGLSSTDITFIMTMNSSFGQICGVLQGPLLKKFGYRKMAIFAVTCFSIGTLLTGWAESLLVFVITHGMITSLGFTFSFTSFSIALNSYFRENRSKAQGILMGFQGLGPIIMPFLITTSISEYGTQWTAFLLAALNCNSYAGALLLQPVSWHMKKRKIIETVEIGEPRLSETSNSFRRHSKSSQGTLRKMSSEVSVIDMYQADAHSLLNVSASTMRRLSNASVKRRYQSECEDTPRIELNGNIIKEEDESECLLRHQSALYLDGEGDLAAAKSLLSIRATAAVLASMESLGALDNPELQLPSICVSAEVGASQTIEQEFMVADSSSESIADEKRCGWFHKCGSSLYNTFDLDLLSDSTYVVITLGLSIAMIGELVFSLLTPFILAELGLNMEETALFMSISAGADIVARFLAPHLQTWLAKLFGFNSRTMYIIALCLLFVTRLCLLFELSKIAMYFVAAGIGSAKGVRTVFWVQVLPDNVPLKKLGSAMSIQNLTNGVIVFLIGPLGGKIVEIDDNYLNIIYFANVLSAITILLWSGEYVIRKIRHPKKESATKCNTVIN